MDLIRKILIQVEDAENNDDLIFPEIPDASEKEINYNIGLLAQAGFIRVNDMSTTDGEYYGILCMTWSGHEFLDAARNEGIWNKAKGLIKSNVSSVSFEVLKTVLIDMAKEKLGLRE